MTLPFAMAQRSAGAGEQELDDSLVRRDARGLARYNQWGHSLLTPSSVDPGPRPKTQNSDSKPGDNIVPWFQWEDANYAWEIANERFHLPPDYVPPALSAVVRQSTAAVITNTEEMVKANAVADRRAAGIADGDWTSSGTPVQAFIPSIVTPPNSPATVMLNANREASGGYLGAGRAPATYLKNGVLVDENDTPVAQPLPTNNTTATAPGIDWRKYLPIAVAIVVVIAIAYAMHRRGSS